MAKNSYNPAGAGPELYPTCAGRGSGNAVLLLLIFTACVAWIVLTRLHTADEPLERDICTQILMGRELADGGKLYVDTIEFKPPGMFVIWQIIHQSVGTGPRVVLWANILVTTLSMFGVFWAGSAKPWGRWGGIWAMCFWTLISGDMMLQANQPNNEVFINMFTIWGVAFWVRADSAQAGWKHYVAAGLFLGLATLIKPVLVTVVCMALARMLAGILNLAALKRQVWAIGWVLLPVVTAWGLMVLYFVWQGRGSALFNCLVRYATFYAESQGGMDEGAPSSIWLNILTGFDDKLSLPCMVFLAPLMGLTVLGIAGGWLDGLRTQVLTIAGCLLGIVFAVSIPGTFFQHYYQLYLPILAVGGGWGIAAVANSLRQRLLALALGLATFFLLLWHVAPDLRFDGKTWCILKYGDQAGIFIEVERCGPAINRLLAADELFYVWGNDPGIYYYSDRRPASGIFWCNRLTRGPLKRQTTQKVLDDLNKNQPPLILIQDSCQPPSDHPVYQWIKQHYVQSPETRFSTLFTVYLRRDSALVFRLSTNQQPFVLTLTDVDPRFLKQSADELLQKGRVREAMAYLQKAMAIDSSHPEIANQLAWLLAAGSEANLRDGPRAVKLAKQACQLTDFKQTVFVGTLAAAYAEAGQFEEAISAAQKACALASGSGKPELLKANQERLVLYRAHQSYHEGANPDQTKP